MKLAILDRNLPLRHYKEEELNTALLMNFMPYLTRLLSLTDETSADRLEIALPAIKEHCIGMGFVEIKKMFEMYVDSKLGLKPIPNYFDRILLGKIVSEYKSRRKPKQMEEKKITEQEKELIMLEAVDRVKKEVEQHGKISGVCVHVYDYLDGQGKLPTDRAYKIEIYERAKKIATSEAATKAKYSLEEHRKMAQAIQDIEEKGNSTVINISKRLVLEDYFNL